MSFDTLANDISLQTTADALTANGITTHIFNTGLEAKEWILHTIPQKAEVMTMTSETLETIGVSTIINESGSYDAVRPKLMNMNRETQAQDMQKLGAAPTWTLGSVHAVTEDGKLLIASNTGSQLPAYAYGSQHVIWVVGAQKVTRNIDEAMTRLHDYVLPLEEVRARKAYGIPEDRPGSNISKLLIINKEVNPSRLTVLLVKEKLGF